MMRRGVILAAVFLFATPVLAQTETPNLDRRMGNQDRRIEQGVASGQLTPREAARLRRAEARLKRHHDIAKADGKVTRAERRALQREANRTSARIYRQKHDCQVVH